MYFIITKYSPLTFSLLHVPTSDLLHSSPSVVSVSSRPRCWKGTLETGDKRRVDASELKVFGTYMYLDRYPITIFIKCGFIPAINSLNLSICRIEQLYSGMAPYEEENGPISAPVFLSFATYVSMLRHHHSQVLP